MTSYLRYKQELRTVQDADDIESWITVRGNHIPIRKGQSKEEAVKSFISNKSDKALSERENKPQTLKKGLKKVVNQAKKNKELYEASGVGKKEKWSGKWKKESAKQRNENFEKAKSDLPKEKLESYLDKIGEINKKHDNLYAEASTKEEKEKIIKEWSKKGNEVVNEVIKEANTTKQSDWMSKKPDINLEKLRNGDIKEMDKYFKWGNTGNSDWFEEQKKKDFGSKESEYKAYDLYDKNRKKRSQTNKNYLDDEISEGLLEISYNYMQFSNNVEKNRSNLIKAIKESKHDKSKQMVDIISNMPDKMLSNFPSFVKALEAASEGKAKSLKKSSMDSWKRLWGKK